MISLIKRLTAVFGPSGYESAVADEIETLLKGHVDSIARDALGNLVCVKNGADPSAKKILFSAHMDQIGFIVTAVEKEGFLRVAPVGGVPAGCSKNRHVRFANGVEGILAEQALKPGEKDALRFFYVDIGAENDADALARISIGDMAVSVPDCFVAGEHRVFSPILDDRAACALLVKLLLDLPACRHTVIAVFSTQEEVGCRGAATAAYAAEPDEGVALDVTPAEDVPEGEKQINVKLGKGPAVKIMDQWSISNPGVVSALLAAAQKAGVPVQREVLPYGGTDAGSIQRARGGVPVCTLSLPCRYVHTPGECVDLRDLDAAEKLLLAYLN